MNTNFANLKIGQAFLFNGLKYVVSKLNPKGWAMKAKPAFAIEKDTPAFMMRPIDLRPDTEVVTC